MNQITSEPNAKRKPYSIMEIAGGILGLAVGVLLAIASYQLVVSQMWRALHAFEKGEWLGAASALVIPIMLVCGLVSWFKK